MKTCILTLILALALLLFMPCLAACDSAETPSPADGMTSIKPAQNSGDEESPTGTEQDYSWFEIPEATERLTVYAAVDWSSSIMSRAVALFRDLSPDVEVDYQIFEMDELMLKIRTEIPEGRGPDLLLFSQVELPDVYKTMTTGLFEDLNPYFAADGGIDLDAFIRPVMDEGLIGGAACSPRSTTTCRFC